MNTTEETRLGVLENVRAILIERRARAVGLSLPSQMDRDLHSLVLELAQLYSLRDEVNVQIAALEAKLKGTDAPVTEPPVKTRQRRRSRGFQKPTLDILALFKTHDVLHRQEVLKKAINAYGNRYTPSAVRSSLYRLTKAGILERDGDFYRLPSKRKKR